MSGNTMNPVYKASEEKNRVNELLAQVDSLEGELKKEKNEVEGLRTDLEYLREAHDEKIFYHEIVSDWMRGGQKDCSPIDIKAILNCLEIPMLDEGK